MGLSRAGRKTLAALTLCELVAVGIVQNYRERPRSKTIRGLGERLTERCEEAAKAFGLRRSIPAKDVDRVAARLRRFEEQVLRLEPIPLTVATSLALGALDEPLREVTDPARRRALERVETTLRQIHRYWDRRLDKWADYETATRYLDSFDKMVVA